MIGGALRFTPGKSRPHRSRRCAVDDRRLGRDPFRVAVGRDPAEGVNLPRRDKMMKPRYQELRAAEIPTATSADGKVTVTVIAGVPPLECGALAPLSKPRLAAARRQQAACG